MSPSNNLHCLWQRVPLMGSGEQICNCTFSQILALSGHSSEDKINMKICMQRRNHLAKTNMKWKKTIKMTPSLKIGYSDANFIF